MQNLNADTSIYGKNKQKCEIIGKAFVIVRTFLVFRKKVEATLFRYKHLVFAMDEEGHIIGKVLNENPKMGGTYRITRDKSEMPSLQLKMTVEREYAALASKARHRTREFEKFKLTY
jgi:hypothetical protein